jgi:type VI secretion system secreted protein VgrG
MVSFKPASTGLGHLIHQAPDSATRGAWRGSGFELRSDGWLAVRSGEGLLVSATARPNASSTQMDVAETVGQLKAAEATAKALSDAASAQSAQPLKANTVQTNFINAIDPAKDGHFEGEVGGQPAKKAQPGSRDLSAPTERFAKPFIVSEAPGDIGLTSPASSLVFAGQQLHVTAQQDAHLAATHTVSVVAGEGASWFSHSGGIKAIAAAGSNTIQAHTDAMSVLADQSVTVTSSNDEIHILANSRIVLQAGQSSVTLAGGDITLRILQADGSKRAWHGYVTEALQRGADGGLARYRLPLGKIAKLAYAPPRCICSVITFAPAQSPRLDFDLANSFSKGKLPGLDFSISFSMLSARDD